MVGDNIFLSWFFSLLILLILLVFIKYTDLSGTVCLLSVNIKRMWEINPVIWVQALRVCTRTYADQAQQKGHQPLIECFPSTLLKLLHGCWVFLLVVLVSSIFTVVWAAMSDPGGSSSSNCNEYKMPIELGQLVYQGIFSWWSAERKRDHESVLHNHDWKGPVWHHFMSFSAAHSEPFKEHLRCETIKMIKMKQYWKSYPNIARLPQISMMCQCPLWHHRGLNHSEKKNHKQLSV